jgi:hypothetical protein
MLALGLNDDELLIHGIERCMYGVKLAANIDRYLLGLDDHPEWIIDPNAQTSDGVSDWWMTRWAGPRAAKAEVLDRMKQETLVHPIRHHARVRLGEIADGQAGLFKEHSD